MKVKGLGHFPLGTPVPQKEHAVCVSLPTLDDVVGYEEKNPATLEQIKSGYPRFVRHRKIQQLETFWGKVHLHEKKISSFSQIIKTGILPKKYSGLVITM